MKIGFIGTGKMGQALINTLKGDNDLYAADVYAPSLEPLKDFATITSNIEVVKQSDIIFLCVKPQDMTQLLKEISDETKGKLIISIAAGIQVSTLEKHLPEARCIRVMPNTPCLVGEMAAAFSLGSKCEPKDKLVVSELLSKSGVAIELDESLIDAVTGLSGSGPAFFAYIVSAFSEAGEKQGLPKDVSYNLALQTMLGTAKLLKETKLEPKRLIEMVSSPKGTTVAGRNILENSDVKEIIQKTVEKATDRSKELSNK